MSFGTLEAATSDTQAPRQPLPVLAFAVVGGPTFAFMLLVLGRWILGSGAT